MKQGWEIKKLGEVAHISPSKSEVKTFALNPMDMVSFLPMEDLTIGRTFVHPNKQKTLSEVEGSYTYFKEGDVLLAKVTPCFENGKLAIAKGLCNNIGFGSSEYIVIRPMQHIVNSQYLIYLLQTNAFRNGGRTLMIGACGLKRLPKPYVANYELPVPSLAEQERIVEILDREFEKIDALKANAERSLQQAKDLFQSALKQELQPKEGWHTAKLKDEVRVINGRAYKKEELLAEGKYRVLRVGNFFTNESWYYSNLELDEDKYCEDGDLLYAWSASFGPKIWTGEKVIYHYHIWKMITNGNIDKRYLFYWLQSSHLTNQVMSNLHGTTMAHITKGIMETTIIGFPSLETQLNIVSHLDKLCERRKALEENYTKTMALCDDMKQALLRQAFNGEL